MAWDSPTSSLASSSISEVRGTRSFPTRSMPWDTPRASVESNDGHFSSLRRNRISEFKTFVDSNFLGKTSSKSESLGEYPESNLNSPTKSWSTVNLSQVSPLSHERETQKETPCDPASGSEILFSKVSTPKISHQREQGQNTHSKDQMDPGRGKDPAQMLNGLINLLTPTHIASALFNDEKKVVNYSTDGDVVPEVRSGLSKIDSKLSFKEAGIVPNDVPEGVSTQDAGTLFSDSGEDLTLTSSYDESDQPGAAYCTFGTYQADCCTLNFCDFQSLLKNVPGFC